MLEKLSFEFFPPRSPEAEKNLQQTWRTLAQLNPEFFSVTFGAGGTTREKTAETVFAIKKDIQHAAAPHISCMGSTRESILALLKQYQEQGVQHLVVLRGDLPSGFVGSPGEFRHAADLVKFIREQTGQQFQIYVAAYPEFHPETPDALTDFAHFKNKVASGADCAITQYFFNADAFFFFRDLCEKHQVRVPLIPGIMPIHNVEGLKRFSQICGAEIPLWLNKRFAACDDNVAAVQELGIELVTRLCETLVRGGVPGLHFYTLNKAEPTLTICRNLLGK